MICRLPASGSSSCQDQTPCILSPRLPHVFPRETFTHRGEAGRCAEPHRKQSRIAGSGGVYFTKYCLRPNRPRCFGLYRLLREDDLTLNFALSPQVIPSMVALSLTSRSPSCFGEAQFQQKIHLSIFLFSTFSIQPLGEMYTARDCRIQDVGWINKRMYS